MLKPMEKIAELKRAKLLALSLLLIAVAIFITTLLLPPTPWVSALKAISEAAMVGALADWFAVVALFRRIPLPFISRHTAIIPRNKDRIADHLGYFVQEKFLDTPSLVALIRRYEPALMLGNWFSQPENARRVGHHLLQVAGSRKVHRHVQFSSEPLPSTACEFVMMWSTKPYSSAS